MTTSFPARHEGPASTLRRFKLLVIVLVLSNIGLGVFSVYLLRKMDRRYSELLENSVPVLGDLQDLTMMSVQAMRMTNPTQFAATVPPAAQRAAAARKVLDDERKQRAKILQADWVVAACPERTDLQAAGSEFSRIGDDVLNQLNAGQSNKALRMRDEFLRPAFDRYLTSVSNAADLVERESRRANQHVSAQTGNMSAVVLSLASWPLLAVAGLFLVTGAFVLVLMVMFRGREISDMP